MLNATEKKVSIRIVLLSGGALLLFYLAAMLLNLIPAAAAPLIKTALVILFVIALSLAKMPTEISFLICGVVSCILLGIPFYVYGDYMWNNFSSSTIFMVGVCGAVVALFDRSDLSFKLSRINEKKDPDSYRGLEREAAVFCLFERLQRFIQRLEKRSVFLSGIVLLLQNLLLFVSSIVAATTFSTMYKQREQRSAEKENYVNAGILCMCTSGCLLLFFVLKSPWWLFFSEFQKDLGIEVTLPVATLIYALFSFIHGYYLIRKGSRADYQAPQKKPHPFEQRDFTIYIGLIIVFLIIMLPLIGKALTGKNFKAPNTTEVVITVLLLLIVSILAATYIVNKIMRQTQVAAEHKDTIGELRTLMLGDAGKNSGIKSVVSVIILIITILSLRDMIKNYVSGGVKSGALTSTVPFQLFSSGGAFALLLCLAVLAVVLCIGYLLGSNFGAFSIGFIIFNLLASHFTVLSDISLRRWLFEAVIILSTFCNQVSPVSSNASSITTYLSDDTRVIQKGAWKSKSLCGISACNVQVIAAVFCIGLSALLTACGLV